AFAHLGRDAEVREAAAHLLEVDPGFTISAWIARGARWSGPRADQLIIPEPQLAYSHRSLGHKMLMLRYCQASSPGGHMHRRAFMSLVGGAAAMCPQTARARRPAMPAVGDFGTGEPTPLYFAASKETIMAEKGVSVAFAEGTGSFLVLLAMAEQQGL